MASAQQVVTNEALVEAWGALSASSESVHPHFFGYLAILAAASKSAKRSKLAVNFKQFFEDYLRAPDLKPEYPYLQPFSNPPFRNKNVAGSYALSSLRENAPILLVADVSQDEKGRPLFSLKSGHASEAYENLLGEKRLPSLAFAAFLLRDEGFDAPVANEAGLKAELMRVLGLSASEHRTLFYRGSIQSTLFESA